jgi:hypothetical protein
MTLSNWPRIIAWLLAGTLVAGAFLVGIVRILAPEDPQPDRRIGVFQLRVDSGPDGEPLVDLVSSRVVTDFAPAVFGRAGPWTVVLVRGGGQPPASFGVWDPRLVDVESNSSDPHTSMRLAAVSWELRVPLQRGDDDLSVTQIVILDERLEPIFAADALPEDAGFTEVGDLSSLGLSTSAASNPASKATAGGATEKSGPTLTPTGPFLRATLAAPGQ